MITIYGSSDDLIEIEGDVTEEFYAKESEPNYLGFSNGVLARIEYNDDGEWAIRVLHKPKNVGTSIFFVGDSAITESGRYNDYTDVLCIEDSIDWVTHGEGIAR